MYATGTRVYRQSTGPARPTGTPGTIVQIQSLATPNGLRYQFQVAFPREVAWVFPEDFHRDPVLGQLVYKPDKYSSGLVAVQNMDEAFLLRSLLNLVKPLSPLSGETGDGSIPSGKGWSKNLGVMVSDPIQAEEGRRYVFIVAHAPNSGHFHLSKFYFQPSH